MVLGLGTGIAPPSTHPYTLPGTHPVPHPGYTPASTAGPPHRLQCGTVRGTQSNMAVGLRSVHQLSLYYQISDIRGMTEVYNVAIAGNPNDHK